MDYIITSRDRHDNTEKKKRWDKIFAFYKGLAEDPSSTPKSFTIAPAIHNGIYSNGARVNYPQRKTGDDNGFDIVEINDITVIKVWELPNDKSVSQKECYAFQILLQWTTGYIEILLDDEDIADFKARKITIDAEILKREAEIKRNNQPLSYVDENIKSLQKQIDELLTGKVKVK